HWGARVHDFAGRIGPLPHQSAGGRNFHYDYVEIADLICPGSGARGINASVGCDGDGVARGSVRDSLPDEVAGRIKLDDEKAGRARSEARRGAGDMHRSIGGCRYGQALIGRGATPGPLPQQRSVRVEFQEHRVIPVISGDAGYVDRAICANRDVRSSKPADRRPIPDPLPGDRAIRCELHDEDSGTWISKLIRCETVSDTYDVRASVGRTRDALCHVTPGTAPCRFCEQRLALNAANAQGDSQNDQYCSQVCFHGFVSCYVCCSRFRRFWRRTVRLNPYCVCFRFSRRHRAGNKPAKGYEVVTIAEYTFFAVADFF